MLFLKLLVRTLLYLLSTMAVVAIAVLIKFLALILAEQYFYSIPVFGDLPRSIDLIELANILVFAVLGMGIGLSTLILPRYFGLKVSQILLIVLIPLIFNLTSVVRYSNWLANVREQEGISEPQAAALTNTFLQQRTGHQGIFGFYLYTAKFPVLPKTAAEMQGGEESADRATAKVSQLTGVKQSMVSAVYAAIGWGLRLFYFIISVLTALTHFRLGLMTLLKRPQPHKVGEEDAIDGEPETIKESRKKSRK